MSRIKNFFGAEEILFILFFIAYIFLLSHNLKGESLMMLVYLSMPAVIAVESLVCGFSLTLREKENSRLFHPAVIVALGFIAPMYLPWIVLAFFGFISTHDTEYISSIPGNLIYPLILILAAIIPAFLGKLAWKIILYIFW